ncbi:hypothetical protein J7L13_03330 [bacterium]|nr:hypothetical protein [bacterium]
MNGKILLWARSQREAKLFWAISRFFSAERVYFATPRVDVFIWLKVKGGKVFFCPPKVFSGKVKKSWEK